MSEKLKTDLAKITDEIWNEVHGKMRQSALHALYDKLTAALDAAGLYYQP